MKKGMGKEAEERRRGGGGGEIKKWRGEGRKREKWALPGFDPGQPLLRGK